MTGFATAETADAPPPFNIPVHPLLASPAPPGAPPPSDSTTPHPPPPPCARTPPSTSLRTKPPCPPSLCTNLPLPLLASCPPPGTLCWPQGHTQPCKGVLAWSFRITVSVPQSSQHHAANADVGLCSDWVASAKVLQSGVCTAGA